VLLNQIHLPGYTYFRLNRFFKENISRCTSVNKQKNLPNKLLNQNTINMRKIAVTLFAAILAINLSAQDNEVFSKGDKVLNVGIGFGGGYYTGFASGYSKTPFLSASFDVGVFDGFLDNATVGIGGYVGFSSLKWESGLGYGWKQTNFVIGPRGTFNYQFVDNLDTYAGILLGYHVVSTKETGNWTTPYNSAASGVYFSGFAGARYYFTDNIAAFLELGSGNLALASLGVVVKF
jgi:hypothetical protein